jgi:hypothetical protein
MECISIVSLVTNIFYIQTIFAHSMAKIFKGFVIALICCVLFSNKAVAQNHSDESKAQVKKATIDDVAAFQIFDSKGKKVSYAKFIKALQKSLPNKSDSKGVLLFGELHDNPIAHWLELQVTQDLYAFQPNMILGAEMFETDQQTALNTYLNPPLDTTKKSTSVNPMGMGFGPDPNYIKLKKSIKLWNNFVTDYQPLVDFAKENHLPFVATNIPRRYASLVYKSGIGAVYGKEGAKNGPQRTFSVGTKLPSCDTGIFKKDSMSYFAEINKGQSIPPIFVYDSTLQCYKDIFAMAGGHGGQNLPMSQAIKDATMASQIYIHLPSNGIFVHYNGSYHSDNHQSIEWYLNQYNQNILKNYYQMNVVTISTRMQMNVSELENENKGIANFIIVVPENMTRTYK